MTVRCGNHGKREHVYHANAAEVRACFAGKLQYDETTSLFNDDLDPPGERQHRRASFDGAEHDATFAAVEREQEQKAFEAKQERDRKLASNDWQKTKLNLDHVWEGAYAVTDPADGKLRFLEVDRPDEGKWNGFIFVKVRASDELHKLGTQSPRYGTYAGKAPALVGVLAAMDKDTLQQAAIRFGLEIGECGFCRRSLTDEDSRGLGYGPVCAGRHGLPHPRARAS
jgi:hypothetical protein